MDVFVIFSILCFVLYVQAAIFILWRDPFPGTHLWFALLLGLHAVWALAFVFSQMLTSNQTYFQPSIIAITGICLFLPFYFRVIASLLLHEQKQLLLNIIFAFLLFISGIAVRKFVQGDSVMADTDINFLTGHPVFLLYIVLGFLVFNAFLITRLQKIFQRPEKAAGKVVEKIGHFMLLCNKEGIIINTNIYTLALTGRDRENLIGSMLSSNFSDSHIVKEYFSKSSESGYAGPVSVKTVSAGERLIPVKLEFVRIGDINSDVFGIAVLGYENLRSTKLEEEIKKLGSVYDLQQVKIGKHIELLRQYMKELASLQASLSGKYESSQDTEDSIIAGIEEREMLTGEIHERVIDNMNLVNALIKSHLNENSSENLSQKLESLSRKMYAILLVHKHLYFSVNYSQVDFKEFIKECTQALLNNFTGGEKVFTDLHISDSFVNIEKAIPLGIILNEAITNSMLHAWPEASEKLNVDSHPELQIEFSNVVGDMSLMVSDNGVGFSDGFKAVSDSLSGLGLVKMLVEEQISGQLDIQSDSSGTKIKISFKNYE